MGMCKGCKEVFNTNDMINGCCSDCAKKQDWYAEWLENQNKKAILETEEKANENIIIDRETLFEKQNEKKTNKIVAFIKHNWKVIVSTIFMIIIIIKIDNLNRNIWYVESDINNIESRISDIESRISDIERKDIYSASDTSGIESKVRLLELQISSLELELSSMKWKVDDIAR